jgi:hypothetical protein
MKPSNKNKKTLQKKAAAKSGNSGNSGSVGKTSSSGNTGKAVSAAVNPGPSGNSISLISEINTKTNEITCSKNHGLKHGDNVTFTSTGSLPAGLKAGIKYVVFASSSAKNVFQVGEYASAQPVVLKTQGSGTIGFFKA